MTIDLDKLEALAKAATQPTPWSVHEDEHGRCVVLDDNGMWVADCGPAPEDATFIAAANPAVVLELINELREVRESLRSSADYHKRVCATVEAERDQLKRDLAEALDLMTLMLDELESWWCGSEDLRGLSQMRRPFEYKDRERRARIAELRKRCTP